MRRRWCKDCGMLYIKESKYNIFCPVCKNKRLIERQNKMRLTYEIRKLINQPNQP